MASEPPSESAPTLINKVNSVAHPVQAKFKTTYKNYEYANKIDKQSDV